MTSHPNRNRSTEKVTLIRRRSGFTNKADTFHVTHDPDSADPYTEVAETYWLPSGYTVAQSVDGVLCIYDRNDVYCSIVEHRCGLPRLVSGARDMPILKCAE